MTNNDVLISLLRRKFGDKPELQFEQKEGDKSNFTGDQVTMTYENGNESWPIVSYECEDLVSVAKATGYNFLVGYNVKKHIVTVNYYNYGY